MLILITNLKLGLNSFALIALSTPLCNITVSKHKVLKIKLLILSFICVGFILSHNLNAQSTKLGGTVYDYFNKKPLDAVTVLTSSGSRTITDSTGKFTITVTQKDSVWF